MKNMNTTRIITCLFLFSLFLAGCQPLNPSSWPMPGTSIPAPVKDTSATSTPDSQAGSGSFASLPPVRVAILLPLSGPKSAIGESMLQAAQLALFDMGYNNFNLMPRDTKGTAGGASAAAISAVNDGAELILGPLFADSVKSVKSVVQRHNINVIAFTTDWTLSDRKTFLMGFMPFSQVDRVAQHALEKGYKNFALVAPRDKYGDMVAERFEQVARSSGGNITNSLRFTPGDPAVINQIEGLKPQAGQPGFNAVFMPVGGSQTETISSALSYNRLMPQHVKRIGTGLWDDPRIAAQPNMQGAWFAAPSPRSRARFEQQYQNTYGQKPQRLATLAYDATALAAILARNGFMQSNRADFSYRALTNPNGFNGTDGIFRFRSNGLVERGLAVLELRNGRIVEVAPAPKRF